MLKLSWQIFCDYTCVQIFLYTHTNKLKAINVKILYYCFGKIYLTSVKQEYAINHKEKSFWTYLMFLWEQILSISNKFKCKVFSSWKADMGLSIIRKPKLFSFRRYYTGIDFCQNPCSKKIYLKFRHWMLILKEKIYELQWKKLLSTVCDNL